MKYLGLAYYSPEKFAAMPPEAIEALVSQCPALDEKMRATGKVLVSASLGEPGTWTTLRPRSGEAQVSGGPTRVEGDGGRPVRHRGGQP